MQTVQVPIQVQMDQLQPWMLKEEEAIHLLMVLPQHGMQMVVEPILMQMVPLVLILQMVRVPILMPMEIPTAWMQTVINHLQVQMAHQVP